ncbi:hypothetical protein IAU60_005588 [Kwoniella sp. DSM 27419]
MSTSDAYDDTANAQAGPSRPRPSPPLAPPLAPATPPPATPPTAKSVKRRSWFGLGSPSVISSPTPKPKDKAAKEKHRRRSSTGLSSAGLPIDKDDVHGEEVELASLGTRPSADGPRPAVGANATPGPSSRGLLIADPEEELTIDGELVSTVKKKKKKKKRESVGVERELEAMRLEDMTKPRSMSMTAPAQVSEELAVSGARERPAITPRTFSRTASDRDPFTTPTTPPRPSRSSSKDAPVILPRDSSIMARVPSQVDMGEYKDRIQPPIPIDMERPLPPLPPDPTSPVPIKSHAQHALPEMPRGIVVTPSSPRKPSRTPSRTAESERRSRSATGRPREIIPPKRAQSLAPKAPIGLGLPSGLVASPTTASPAAGQAESPASAPLSPPPPVPTKQQSVSSPFPSRSNSPVPRIAFVEPDVPPSKLNDASTDPPVEEKRNRVRRARSLSGLFGKSPPVVQSPKVTDADEPTPEPKEPAVSESVGKASGVLEWLGVRRSAKRKMSASNLKNPGTSKGNPKDSPGDAEHLKPDEEVEGEKEGDPALAPSPSTESDSLRATPRPVASHPGRSTSTIMPSEGSRVMSIFTRRASARSTEDGTDLEPPSVKIAPVPIPNAGRRNQSRGQTATSSESSLHLPTVDRVSPFVSGDVPWMSSPQTEGEETLYSPEGGAHWGPGVRPWMDGSGRVNSSRSSLSSPLEALPEQGPPDLPSPLAPPAAVSVREGRVRSWSDAPLPPQRLPVNSSTPHLPVPQPGTPSIYQSQSLSASPQTPGRPKLGSRSNSGNSAIIGRMRSVFSKSTSRSRSNSLLRQASSDMDEFGNLQLRDGDHQTAMRPSMSASSVGSSSALRARSMGSETGRPALGPQIDTQKEESPRTSFAPSVSSIGSASRQLSVPEPQAAGPDVPATRRNRARASTIALGPTSYHHFGPPSPNLIPAAATPPRSKRPGTIHRLSNGLFGSTSSSPKSTSLFPLPPRSSGGSLSSPMTGSTPTPQWDEGSAGFLSPGTSPRPSTGSISAAMSNSAIKQAMAREDDEEPRQWLERVIATIPRQEISNVLAASGDGFYIEALRLYMSSFDFTHNALDVALRRLLMHISLPKETQQIDRVIEAFAQRYEQCEPGLFGAKDNTYVLAFSMMMLHTDAFNKHNKNKMTKPDYVRNTRLDGVSPLVLEAFFDNITYTPFIFVEDDTDLKRSSGYESTSSTFGPSTPTFAGPLGGPTAPPPSSKTKIDVYHVIVRGLLDTLRVDVERQIPVNSPFSTFAVDSAVDMEWLCRAFANAHSLVIPASAMDRHKKAPAKLTTPARRHTGGEHRLQANQEQDSVLRVSKIGLLSRKDDAGEFNKKASRKWKSWSVILTGSQLLFFKDPTWALTLLEQVKTEQAGPGDKPGQLSLPRQSSFRPDEVLPVKDCIAVYDRSYTAYPHTFRFVMPQSQQYLLQATDDDEMKEWITLINYASAFKTANLKMKGPSMRKDQVVLAGAAAAASHQRELKGGSNETLTGAGIPSKKGKTVFGPSNGLGLSGEEAADEGASGHASSAFSLAPTLPIPNGHSLVHGLDSAAQHLHLPKIKSKPGDVKVDDANEVVHEGEQLEEVFGVVKAELATGRGQAQGSAATAAVSHSFDDRKGSVEEMMSKKQGVVHTSRVAQIYDNLRRLRAEVEPLEAELKTSLLLTRNIALLTPFQKTTRDRLSSSLPPIAHRIRSDRLRLAKLKLWIRVLEHEGEREDREWKVVRHVALQAAARSLREDGLKGIVRDVNRQVEQDVKVGGLPKLALSGGEADHEQEVLVQPEGESRAGASGVGAETRTLASSEP